LPHVSYTEPDAAACSHIHHFHHDTLSDDLQNATEAVIAVPLPVPADIAIVVRIGHDV